jgi:hypothetical protein
MSDQPPQQQSYHDDEIDLRKIIQTIGRFFVSIGHGIISMILLFRRVTLRYKVLLGLAVVVGIIAGLASNQLIMPRYQTSILLKSDYLNAKLVENGIDKLNLLCEEDDRAGLSKVLNIDKEAAINIRGFEFKTFVTEEFTLELELMKQRLEALNIDKADIERIVEQIEIENQNTFMISVSVLNTNIIGKLEAAVVGYFRNNPYVANRIKSNNARLGGLVAKLSRDIVLLDSLKNAYNFSLKQQATKSSDASSLILAERSSVDPTRAYTEGVTLFKLLQDSKTELELGSDFEVVDGFTTFSKPESPGLVKSAILVAGIFLALAYVFIMLIEINSYLNKIEEHGFKN